MKYVIAEADAQGQKQLLEAKAQAERDKIAAQSASEVERIAAESAAQTKRIDAQATDDYERIVQGHMSDRMLQWQRIEAMKTLAASSNAKVIMVGGEGKTSTTLDINERRQGINRKPHPEKNGVTVKSQSPSTRR